MIISIEVENSILKTATSIYDKSFPKNWNRRVFTQPVKGHPLKIHR